MQKTPIIIDLFINVVDNYGDMGFTCEFIEAFRNEYPGQFSYSIWTNNAKKMQEFARQSGISGINIVDIVDFGKMRKPAIGISLLHSSIPNIDFFEEKALILRIDYLSIDPIWINNNEKEHVASTANRQIIELIPSPLLLGAGLIPIQSQMQELRFGTEKHITIFSYPETGKYIDWESFPDDLIVYVFGEVKSRKENIIPLDFLPVSEFYSLLHTSEFVIIRGEVSFAHIVQTPVPFFWDMYRDTGGFPLEQSDQFLYLIGASSEYQEIHQIINQQKLGKITYQNMVSALSCIHFGGFCINNLIHTVKKHIDRFHNSI